MNTGDLRARIRQSIADENLQIALDGNAQRRTVGRLKAFSTIPDYQDRRRRAHAIKADVITHLDEYLSRFIARVTANGIQVHHAANAEAGHPDLPQNRLREECPSDRQIEIHGFGGDQFQPRPRSRPGYSVVETDLGEYIVQLRGERPSHILTPAVHLRRGQVGQLFHEKLGTPYTEDIPEMVATARRVLRAGIP